MAVLLGNKLHWFERSSGVPDTEQEGSVVLCESESRQVRSAEIVFWKRIVIVLLSGE